MRELLTMVAWKPPHDLFQVVHRGLVVLTSIIVTTALQDGKVQKHFFLPLRLLEQLPLLKKELLMLRLLHVLHSGLGGRR